LPQHIGDKLIDEGVYSHFNISTYCHFIELTSGVHLHSGYGATEIGAILDPYDLNRDPHDWAYISILPNVGVQFDRQNDDEKTCEIIFLVRLLIN
jgi:acyl-coenzyme A synthetase/AMP-(fatty) acid ligase